MIKKLIALALTGFMLLSAAGCQQRRSLTTSVAVLNQSESRKVTYYDSIYTICYKNRNGTYDTYIFSSPIQYKDETGYHIIDNTVMESKHASYSYENKANDIKTYFPDTLDDGIRIQRKDEFIEFKPALSSELFSKAQAKTRQNAYGDEVSGVEYSGKQMDLFFYPARAGVMCEAFLKQAPQGGKLSFSCNSSAKAIDNPSFQYLLFKNQSDNMGILQAPVIFSGKEENLQPRMGTVEANRSGSDYLADIPLKQAGEFPATVSFSVELYQNKLPDACAYEKSGNAYLSDHTVVGTHPDFGQGIAYTRTRINYFLDIPVDNVLTVSYCIPQLFAAAGAGNVELREVTQQWSSSNLSWETKTPLGDLVAQAEQQDGMLCFDITRYAKECLEDFSLEKESVGLALQMANNEGYTVLASSDHALYAPYIRIHTNTMPGYFVPKDNINEQL